MNNWLKVGVLLGIVGVIGCDGNFLSPSKTKGTETTLGKCNPDRPISLTEDTNPERGFFNPEDSLYYSTIVYGTFYRGGLINPCELVRRPYDYKNVISRKFRIVWESPKGETDRKIPRALIRFTDKGYQDDIDRNLPLADTLHPFPYEIQVKEDSSYVNLITNREYKVALRKGYSGELNQVKCAEVSLSSTKSFDTKRVILENAKTTSWSQRYFFKATDFTPDVQYIVVREKECAVCDMPIPTLSAAQTSISKGQDVLLTFSGCPAVDGAQGPLEWFAQPTGGQKYVVQRFSYSARNERRFTPEVTTTYSLRCQGDWYCKPQKEASITIEVK